MYISYNAHERRAQGLIWADETGVLKELQVAQNDRLGLSASFLKPFQRIVKYRQFLEQFQRQSEVGSDG